MTADTAGLVKTGGRMASNSRRQFRLGAWSIRPETNSIARDGISRSLQPLSMDILLYLAERRGSVVTSQELIDEFWRNRIVGDDAVYRRIADLRRNLDDDAKHPTYIETISKRGYRIVADVSWQESMPPAVPTGHRRMRTAAAIASVAAISLAVTWFLFESNKQNDARSEAVSLAEPLVRVDSYQQAYDLLVPFRNRSDPRIDAMLGDVSLPVSVYSDPPGVRVAYRYADSDAEWIELGVTPIEDVVLPKGNFRLRFRDDVFMNATNPGVTFNSAKQPLRVIELPIDAVPADMAFVPSGKYRLGAWGLTEATDLGGFLIDRTEVTNAEYFEFVDAGGYQNQEIWQPIIDASNGELSRSMIDELFVDQSGRPGPAGWMLGTYAPRERDLPVVGISWYEAVAYLSTRDKTLPSVHHWLRAALGPMEWKYPFATFLVPQSNIAGSELLPVGSRTGSQSHGAFDLIGNANEWTVSASGNGKAVIGSSYLDPQWSYNFPRSVNPTFRTGDLGFRGMRHTRQSLPDPAPDVDPFEDFSTSVRKVSDEMFEGLRQAYEYHEGTVSAADVETLSEATFDHWIRRKVMIPTSRNGEPMPVFLFIPRRYSPPYQGVIYLPPADSWSNGFSSDSMSLENNQIDFVPRSGRVLVWPVYSGSYERYDNYHELAGAERSILALERNRRIRGEIGRVIDYLDSDSEFDGSKVALLGLSHGAIIASYNLATEKRLKAAILYSVGIAPPNPVFANAQNDPNVFWARVEQPTLIINGRYDPLRPQHYVLEPLVNLLATPDEHKKSILYESAHWPLPRFQMMQDSLDWLDRYLGPVENAARH